jgi:hypothetical protein
MRREPRLFFSLDTSAAMYARMIVSTMDAVAAVCVRALRRAMHRRRDSG